MKIFQEKLTKTIPLHLALFPTMCVMCSNWFWLEKMYKAYTWSGYAYICQKCEPKTLTKQEILAHEDILKKILDKRMK